MNVVTVSADRKTMLITDGLATATLRSAQAEGFTAEQEANAQDWPLHVDTPGQVNRAWRKFGVLFVVNTGPPRWWWPRVQVNSKEVMVGWLDGLVAVRWRS